MLRTSDISSSSDFVLEQQREDLRDRRWHRRCQVAEAFAVAVAKSSGVLIGALTLLHLTGWL